MQVPLYQLTNNPRNKEESDIANRFVTVGEVGKVNLSDFDGVN